MPQNTNCEFCGKPIVCDPKRGYHWRRYCSPECSKRGNQRNQAARRRSFNLQARLGLSGGKIGKINEMMVAIDLIKRGFQVYTAYEATHPFDILAIKDERIFRIEVKTETVLPSGLGYVNLKKGQDGKHDVLARVRNLEAITYEPPLI